MINKLISIFKKPKIMIKQINLYFLIKKLKPLLKNKKICFLTGAGISINSGVSPFRGENGIYTKDPDLIYKLRPDSFETDPHFLYNFHENFRIDLIDKKPNIVHDIITKKAFDVITQNIDDLHEKSGFKKVIHVHGQVNEYRCRSCHFIYKGIFVQEQSCIRCGEQKLRHNVVLFKENLLKNDLALLALSCAEVFIAVGTSGTIYPVAQYPQLTNGITICINPELPENSHMFQYVLIGDPEKILTSLFED
jgi:NAD-dependent deacetylase